MNFDDRLSDIEARLKARQSVNPDDLRTFYRSLIERAAIPFPKPDNFDMDRTLDLWVSDTTTAPFGGGEVLVILTTGERVPLVNLATHNEESK